MSSLRLTIKSLDQAILDMVAIAVVRDKADELTVRIRSARFERTDPASFTFVIDTEDRMLDPHLGLRAPNLFARVISLGVPDFMLFPANNLTSDRGRTLDELLSVELFCRLKFETASDGFFYPTVTNVTADP